MIEAAQVIAQETGCTLDLAQAAVVRLIESGWQTPAARTPSASPSRPDADANPPASDLNLDPDSLLVAHTDGACSGNPGPGGWAVVFSQDGKLVGEHFGHEARTTNNRMELAAIREAIRLAPGNGSLEIATDSKNAIGWLSEGWKRNEPTIAAICADIDQLRARRASTMSGQAGEITFRYVRGHDGDVLNERADRLATGAIQQAPKRGTKYGR